MSFTNVAKLHTTKTAVKKAEEYLKHVLNRTLNSDISQDWGLADQNPGRPQRVHGDAKSKFGGEFTLWVNIGVQAQSRVKLGSVFVCHPGSGGNNKVFNEKHILYEVEVGDIVEAMMKQDWAQCEERTKLAIREGYKYITGKDID